MEWPARSRGARPGTRSQRAETESHRCSGATLPATSPIPRTLPHPAANATSIHPVWHSHPSPTRSCSRQLPSLRWGEPELLGEQNQRPSPGWRCCGPFPLLPSAAA